MIERFHQPRTVRDALSLKRRFQGRAAYLAGGTYLNSIENPASPEDCISLAGLKLAAIEPKAGAVVIGALCTVQELIDHPRVPAALQAAGRQLMSRNIRNVATLGGHLAVNLPYSDLIPTLVALEARVTVVGAGGTTTLRVADYVLKAPAGLITKVTVPKPGRTRMFDCRNIRESANARSAVSVAVAMTPVRKAIQDPIIALGGVARRVVRLTAVEEALDGRPLPTLDDLQAMVSRAVRPVASPYASVAFRKYQAGALVALAFDAARRQRESRP